MNLLTRDRMSDPTDTGTKRLIADIASAGTVVECGQSPQQVEERGERHDRVPSRYPSASDRMASLGLGLTLAAMAKPRPAEREEPEAFDEMTGPME